MCRNDRVPYFIFSVYLLTVDIFRFHRFLNYQVFPNLLTNFMEHLPSLFFLSHLTLLIDNNSDILALFILIIRHRELFFSLPIYFNMLHRFVTLK